jgi:hypothetical protein
LCQKDLQQGWMAWQNFCPSLPDDLRAALSDDWRP